MTEAYHFAGFEFQANSYTTSSSSVPDVAGLTGGGFVAVWTSYGQDGSGYGIYAQRYDGSGAPIESEFRVNTSTVGDQWGGTVLALADGGFLVTWTSYPPGSSATSYGQRYDADGVAVGGEFAINLYDASVPECAELADGSLIFTWTVGNQDVMAQLFNANGSTLGDPFLVNTTTDRQQLGSHVVALGGGGFAIVWHDTNGFDVSGQVFDSAGQRVGSEFRANTYSPNTTQDLPSIAALDDGGFVVVWQSFGQDGDSGGVYGQRFGSDGTLVGVEFRVNNETASDQSRPSVAPLNGGFIVTWHQFSGGSYDVWAQIYDSTGAVSGDQFMVNTAAGQQSEPSVTALADGGFAVVYLSPDSDGSGIFGQRFAPGPPNATIGSVPLSDVYEDVAVTDGLLVLSGTIEVTDPDPGEDGFRPLVVAADSNIGTLTITSAGDFTYSVQNSSTQYLGDGETKVDTFTIMSMDGSTEQVSFTIHGVNEIVRGTNKGEILNGGSFGDSIFGLGGNDRLFGNDGHDQLTGGAGRDTLTGGAGSDVFIYTAVSESAGGTRDRITDFGAGEDHIDLRAIDANTKIAGDQAFNFAETATKVVSPNTISWYYDARNDLTVVQGDVNGDSKADFQINLVGAVQLTSADFFF